jgi:cytochrome c peroxidase
MHRHFALVFIFAIAIIIIGGTNAGTPYRFPELALFPPVPPELKAGVTNEGAELGRYLFYDPLLSRDSTISCSNCHHQKNAFSDSGNLFSTGINGKKQTRNTPALFNLAWQPYYFYDGRAQSLMEQVAHPIRSEKEMNMDWTLLLKRLSVNKFYRKKFRTVFGSSSPDSTQVKNALTQFLYTLLSHRSKFDKFFEHKAKLTDEEFRGFRTMMNQTRGDCLHCHPVDGNALMSTYRFSNNGLDTVTDANAYNDKGRGAVTGKSSDNGKFKIPSLRNIALTAPYMHDGRFKTLEEVLDFYSTGVHKCANIDSKMEYAYQGGVKLSEQEKKDIIAFLNMLTDSAFVSDPEFGSPFSK